MAQWTYSACNGARSHCRHPPQHTYFVVETGAPAATAPLAREEEDEVEEEEEVEASCCGECEMLSVVMPPNADAATGIAVVVSSTSSAWVTCWYSP